MAIDYTTPLGQVRLLTADTDESAPTLTDDQLNGLLAFEDGNVRLAAADALDTVANSEVLVAKVISTQDLNVNGAAVAAALRTGAASLRAQADAAGDDFVCGVVEFTEWPATPELVPAPWPPWWPW